MGNDDAALSFRIRPGMARFSPMPQVSGSTAAATGYGLIVKLPGIDGPVNGILTDDALVMLQPQAAGNFCRRPVVNEKQIFDHRV